MSAKMMYNIHGAAQQSYPGDELWVATFCDPVDDVIGVWLLCPG